MTQSSPHPSRSARGDLQAGRRLSLAMEALGDALLRCDALPTAHRTQAERLASGRSHVPADADLPPFTERLRARLTPVAQPAGAAVTLAPWLGRALAAWLDASLAAVPRAPWTWDVEEALAAAVAARDTLRARAAPVADVYARWYAEGHDEAARAAFAQASALGLDEAVDRWCALGCEGNLERQTATWQRSASGWAESVLGLAVDVEVADATRLRDLQAATKSLRPRERAQGLQRALAKRLAVDEAEVARLLALEAKVRERSDPERAIRRRWTLVKPIAVAVAALEKELGRMPAVSEIAARAGVHEAAVELVLEALGDG